MGRDQPATGDDSCTPALVRAKEALLTAVMAADPSSASTSVVSRTAKGNFLPLGTTPAITHSELDNWSQKQPAESTGAFRKLAGER